MAPLLIGLLAGGGLGILKGNKEIKEKAEQDRFRKVALAMSPWTNMADPGRAPGGDILGSALGGAATGAMVGNMFPAAAAAPAAAGAAAPAAVPQAAPVAPPSLAPGAGKIQPAAYQAMSRMPAGANGVPAALMTNEAFQQAGGMTGDPTLDQLLQYRYMQMQTGK